MVESVSGTRRGWIVALAFTAIMLNYVDRQIIALLKPMLQLEFGWSDRDYSHMASAFQFCAAVSFLGTGWFIDRIGLNDGLGIAGFVRIALSVRTHKGFDALWRRTASPNPAPEGILKVTEDKNRKPD